MGDISDEASLKAAVEGSEGGPRNVSYTKLVAWVTGELRVLASLEEMVSPTSSSDEHSSFLMEVSSFLKELGKLILRYGQHNKLEFEFLVVEIQLLNNIPVL